MLLRSALILGGLLLASACSSPATSAPPVPVGQEFTMRVDNSMNFATPALQLRAGQPVQLTLENVGGMPHDFSLNEGVAEPVKIEAVGGQIANGTFTIDRPGTYNFVCKQPGHELMGMRGTITAL